MKKEFSGSFIDGKKNGTWKYFSEKGAFIIDGEYDRDRPISVWTVRDKKGKKITSQYDYTTSESKVDDGEKPMTPKILGGVLSAAELFSKNTGILRDFWDTYADLKYLATFTIGADSSSTFVLEEINQYPEKTSLVFRTTVQTNSESKLQKIQHSQLSKKLLYYKISEAVSILPPWISEGESTTTIFIPYKVNMR